MATFHAYDFIFDGIPSKNFDLKIVDFGSSGIFEGTGSTNVTIHTQKVERKSRLYYLGRTQEPVLEFELIFARADEISALDRNLISKWLFGQNGYKSLQILQDDLQNVWFNCFLTKPEPLYIGNMNYAFKCKVICDSPFAYSYIQQAISASFAGQGGETYTPYSFNVYNSSSDGDYIYPMLSLEYTGNEFDAFLVDIENITDLNRHFTLTSFLEWDGNVTFDNQKKSITITGGFMSTEAMIYSKFNKNWFRLVPGVNQLSIIVWSGEVGQSQGALNMSISYYEKLKVGG